METIRGKELEQWKLNAEEDYIKTPISVLKYITVLEEQNERLHKPVVMQAEGSDVSEEATVGNSAAGKGVSEGCWYCGNKYIDTMCRLHPAPCKRYPKRA